MPSCHNTFSPWPRHHLLLLPSFRGTRRHKVSVNGMPGLAQTKYIISHTVQTWEEALFTHQVIKFKMLKNRFDVWSRKLKIKLIRLPAFFCFRKNKSGKSCLKVILHLGSGFFTFSVKTENRSQCLAKFPRKVWAKWYYAVFPGVSAFPKC